jgi:cbb3-type cytochrome oxidase maturation protein
MTIAAWILTIVCLSMTGSAALLIGWCWKTGQFEDIEEIKYRMLKDEY